MYVVKADGTRERFQPNKARSWVSWAVGNDLPLNEKLEVEYNILQDTMERIVDGDTTATIHETMISVCLDRKDLTYSRVASNLEQATLYKNMESKLRIIQAPSASFMDIFDVMVSKGLWAGDWTKDEALIEHAEEIDEMFVELSSIPLEFWTVKQWGDKYSLKINKEPVETPAAGTLALAISLHGVTERAFKMARGVLLGKQNYPTPMLNGCRNGNYNLISCCVIQAEDETMSLDIAELIASQMTARKAGIGIRFNTRSKGDPVKGGAVEHLGKHPLYDSLQKTVKKYTQETRGGSATTTFCVIDPEILDHLIWKTQRMELSRRLDKLDFEMAYNDDFGRAVQTDGDWYLFSYQEAPEVWDNFHKLDYMNYVKAAILRGAKYTKIKAWDIIKAFSTGRWETGRIYCNNLTYTNLHTPFLTDEMPITQSNLCEEIALPTRGFTSLEDLMREDSVGEVAFCTIAALNAQELTPEDYMDNAETVVYTLNIAMDKAAVHAVTPSLKASLLRRRSLGIGITGFAGYLYRNGLDFDGSKESLEATASLAEIHYYSLLVASQKYAKEHGVVVDSGIDQNWLPIDTMRSDYSPMMDWEAVRNIPRANSVLVAHMPTESSSLFSGATNGVYPSRNKVINKAARTGRVQFISKYFDPEKHISVWSLNLRMDLYYGAFQSMADQAISADYYTSYPDYEDSKIPMEDCIEWFVRQWYSGNKTAYYQNFRDMESQEEQDQADEDCCKL